MYIYNKGYVCEFGGPHKVDKHTFWGKYLLQPFFLHISVGLPGPLRTAFELKVDLPTAKNQPDATALTEKAINWLRSSKHIKNIFRYFSQVSQNSKMANLGGLYM